MIFYGDGSWIFANEVTKNFVIFDLYNSSPRHSESYRNSFLILGEETTDGIDDSVDESEKNLILISFNPKKNCHILNYNDYMRVSIKVIFVNLTLLIKHIFSIICRKSV